jgi:hypothetical protein
VLRSICVLVFGLLASLQCFAQASLVGTYRLVSNDLRLDGEPIRPMGKSQHGDTLTAYAGPYRVEGNRVLIDVDTAWTEVWRGKQQVRTYELDGRRLTLIVAPQPSATQPGKTLTSRSVWEKID